MPKTRRHHNNDGRRQIKRGKTRIQVEQIAKRLGVPYGTPPHLVVAKQKKVS